MDDFDIFTESAPSVVAPPDYLSGLNAAQYAAVVETEGPVLVLAGAGTGKTRALTARLAHLLATRKAWPSEILCVTFTNKAAREMQERIGRLIGGAVEGMPWLGTFHSVAARMLRRHAELVGLTSRFTIIDTDDQIRVIKQVFEASNLDEKRFPARQFAGQLDHWKNRGWLPAELPDSENDSYGKYKMRELYALYQARLAALNVCDFGDLLLHLIHIYKTYDDVLHSWQERYHYILVDEYQDTNSAQYLWLRLLAQRRKNICCVGDEDQSIYGWRGAEIANILGFERDYPGAKIIRLEQNYRSTGHILGAAGHLIAANASRLGKTLWTADSAGVPVEVVSVWDGTQEAQNVAQRIDALVRQGHSHADMAVLVRATHQTREFEDRFAALAIPYRIVGGQRFYERAEIRDAIAYMRIVAQPADDLAFDRIVNVPKRGLGDKSLQRVRQFAREQKLPMLVAAQQLVGSDELGAAARRSLGTLVQDIFRWQQSIANRSPAEVLRMVLEESGYTAMWQADKSPEAPGRLENLSELARAMEEFASLEAFLEHVALVMDNDAARDEAKVTVMTLHAAKGLEFAAVFLVGWEEGLFPSQRALDEKGIVALEEERRLAYVGITRARLTCTISHAANRRIYGQWQSAIPSRFLAELPDEHVLRTSMLGRQQLSPAADPFAHLSRQTRGGNWVRPPVSPVSMRVNSPARVFKNGERVFHDKFGYGIVREIDGDKLRIAFDVAGEKFVVASFVRLAA